MEEDKLKLEKSKFDFLVERTKKMDCWNLYLANRNIDLSYLRLTAIIIIIVILIYYISCAFGLGRSMPNQSVIAGTGTEDTPPVLSPEEAKKTEESQTAQAKVSQAPRQEGFTPYVSTSLPDLYRSDASFDYAIAKGRSESRLESIISATNDRNYANREDFLFDQTHALVRSYNP